VLSRAFVFSLSPADAREVVLLRVEEMFSKSDRELSSVADRRAAAAVDLDERFLVACDRILLERLADDRPDLVALGEEISMGSDVLLLRHRSMTRELERLDLAMRASSLAGRRRRSSTGAKVPSSVEPRSRPPTLISSAADGEETSTASRSSSPSATRSGRSSARPSRKDRSTRTRKRSSDLPPPAARRSARRSNSSRSLFEKHVLPTRRKYDFSRVGRLKLNTKLGLNTPLDEKILHPQDFYEVIKYLLKLRKNPANVDDIDHLGNRRVRSVGELLEKPSSASGWSGWSAPSRGKMSVYQEMATANAPRPDQREAGHGRDSRVLRVVAALDSSWTRPTRSPRSRTSGVSRRSAPAVCRASARGSRSRRPPDALRPHLPD